LPAAGAYEPERVQLCVQGLILEEHGYACNEGVLYFAKSRERITVPFDDELKQITRNEIDGLRLVAVSAAIRCGLIRGFSVLSVSSVANRF